MMLSPYIIQSLVTMLKAFILLKKDIKETAMSASYPDFHLEMKGRLKTILHDKSDDFSL